MSTSASAMHRITHMNKPFVTLILATHDRRDVVLDTLDHVLTGGLERDVFQVIVVDIASSDGTPEAIRDRFDDVSVLARTDNRGSCAKAYALEHARGTYIVFIDDDSYPHPGSIQRMIEHFEGDERLGAAGFLVHLPDGRMECSALPNVFIGCWCRSPRRRNLRRARPDQYRHRPGNHHP